MTLIGYFIRFRPARLSRAYLPLR